MPALDASWPDNSGVPFLYKSYWHDWQGHCLRQWPPVYSFSIWLLGPLAISSASFSISSLRQTVVFGPSFTGLGKRPVLQPAHHALLLMGKISSTWGRRKNTHFGFSSCIFDTSGYVVSGVPAMSFMAAVFKLSKKSLHACIIFRRSGKYWAWL